MKTSELVRMIKKAGCEFVEHGKEHDKWYSPKTGKFFRVDRHSTNEVAPGTLNAILKDAGLK
jgi:predicted RNA binding protein YcfA (HicA-like mRNA interferase family)